METEVAFISKFPVVNVPVLSKTMVFILLKSSNILESRNKIPDLAALPIPTAMAAGVASPIAHGQEITNTAIDRNKDVLNSFVINQLITKVKNAMPVTT